MNDKIFKDSIFAFAGLVLFVLVLMCVGGMYELSL